jgi:hypothetical protein
MVYIIVRDGVAHPYSIPALIKDNPRTSFPSLKYFSDELAANWGVYPVTDVWPVTASNEAVDTLAIENIGGVWTQVYAVRPMTDEEVQAIRAQASAAMLQRIEQFTAQFTAKYPSAEVASWGTQAAEANAVLAGGSSVVIAAFAATRGVTEMVMAQRIAAKSAAYMTIIGKVAGLRDATFDAIEAAQTPDQIQAVLDGAMTQAQGMAQAMGLVF